MNINFASEHKEPKDCQLIVAITGSKREIVESLENMLAECKDSYGKPHQGIMLAGKLVKQVITPVWDGKSY